jgi:hypothetical protein
MLPESIFRQAITNDVVNQAHPLIQLDPRQLPEHHVVPIPHQGHSLVIYQLVNPMKKPFETHYHVMVFQHRNLNQGITEPLQLEQIYSQMSLK